MNGEKLCGEDAEKGQEPGTSDAEVHSVVNRPNTKHMATLQSR